VHGFPDKTDADASIAMSDDADRIIELYHRHAHAFDRERGRHLLERAWLDRFAAPLPQGAAILDIGCGCGEPIARHLIETGYMLTGVDSSPAMIELCRSRFPKQTWAVADMRRLDLGRRFDGILAWDSFFHLRRQDQRAMFPVFRAHAAAKAALMFTSGPRDGEATGTFQGEPLYHASLAPEEYRALLDRHGFEVVAHASEDPGCGGHTIWLARLRPESSP
jgi:SAM-dependent methyltransferase